MKLKEILILFIILIVFWLVLNNSMAPEILIPGILISLLLAVLFCSKCNIFSQLKFTPKAIWYTILYILVFSWELIKANFDIAYRVLSPSLPINPGIIKAETKLKSRMARLILANSITLTPGTFTVDIIDDNLYIHCVNIKTEDYENYGKQIIGKFEKYLEEIYG